MGCGASKSNVHQVEVVQVAVGSKGDAARIDQRPKCLRADCDYQRHSKQGHGYCCAACLRQGGHGPACEKVWFSGPRPRALSEVNATWRPSLRFGAEATGLAGAKDKVVTETMHIEAHKGKLFATFGSWMSPAFVQKKWDKMQNFIARKDSAKSDWVIDMQDQHRSKFAARFLCLKSIFWSRDSKGQELSPPVNQLVMTYSLGPQGNFIMFRDDEDNRAPQDQFTWHEANYTKVLSEGDGGTARAVVVHRDNVTGVDRIFALQGTSGVVSGVYDPCSECPGKVVWDSAPEGLELPGAKKLPMRCLSLVCANGRIYMSSGGFLLQRFDGTKPVWKVVLDVEQLVKGQGKLMGAVGGIRGMTPVPSPSGKGNSILLCWNPNSNSKSWLLRVDVSGDKHTGVEETSVCALAKRYLKTEDLYYTLAAYNDMLPVHVGESDVFLIGFQIYTGAQACKTCPVDPGQRGQNGSGYWAGGGIAIRKGPDEYTVTEVGGRRSPGTSNPRFTAVRCYAASPFPEENGWVYFGGYDCNSFPSQSTAWIYQGLLTAV